MADGSLPHPLRVAYRDLTETLTAAYNAHRAERFFARSADVEKTILRFVDELVRLPGAEAELKRRAALWQAEDSEAVRMEGQGCFYLYHVYGMATQPPNALPAADAELIRDLIAVECFGWANLPAILRAAEAMIAWAADGAAGPADAKSARPVEYLLSWREVLDALNKKNNNENRRRIRELNNRYSGPITLPRRGGQPRVAKEKLLAWWNGLEARWDELNQRDLDKRASTESQHPYGKQGTVAPDIQGSVKKRRNRSQ